MDLQIYMEVMELMVFLRQEEVFLHLLSPHLFPLVFLLLLLPLELVVLGEVLAVVEVAEEAVAEVQVKKVFFTTNLSDF